MGLIPENYKNKKKLNKDKDKKFTECIKQELIENEISYQIYEIQETNVKLNLSKILYEQLLNEIVEILEHIHLKLVLFRQTLPCILKQSSSN